MVSSPARSAALCAAKAASRSSKKSFSGPLRPGSGAWMKSSPLTTNCTGLLGMGSTGGVCVGPAHPAADSRLVDGEQGAERLLLHAELGIIHSEGNEAAEILGKERH